MASLIGILVTLLLASLLQKELSLYALEAIYLVELGVCICWYQFISSLPAASIIKQFIRDNREVGELHMEFVATGGFSILVALITSFIGSLDYALATSIVLLTFSGAVAIWVILTQETLNEF